jgi:NAD(P)H-nitrite reductase large subunit
MKYVIIGTGVAGVSAAEAIRQIDPDGPITMIGDETERPYCRPMISLVLEGAMGPEALPIRTAAFYADNKITPILGSRVTAIDVTEKTVRCASGQTLPYDRLLIASGADPRPIKAQGLHLSGISYMRHQGHIRSMLGALPEAKSALVLGGGLVGFKAAYGLLKRGLHVVMLIRSGYPLSMQVDETAGKMVREELVRHGLEVHVGTQVTAFEGNRRVQAAYVADGRTIVCDMVVIGKGVLPALSFVPREHIDVDLGVLVGSRMETSVAGIYAAGDVAEGVDIARKTRWVNAIWPEAVIQGRIAGMNMAGRGVNGKGSLSRNVMRIFDMDVLTAGLVAPPPDDTGCEVITRLDKRRKLYRKLIFRGDRLIGLVMVNQIEHGGVLMNLIYSGLPVSIPRQRLLEPGFNVSQVMHRTTFS